MKDNDNENVIRISVPIKDFTLSSVRPEKTLTKLFYITLSHTVGWTGKMYLFI